MKNFFLAFAAFTLMLVFIACAGGAGIGDVSGDPSAAYPSGPSGEPGVSAVSGESSQYTPSAESSPGQSDPSYLSSPEQSGESSPLSGGISQTPVSEPSEEPSGEDSTLHPPEEPSKEPPEEPSKEPPEEPSKEPPEEPSEGPSKEPSGDPPQEPTEEPSEEPSKAPPEEPSEEPPDEPSEEPPEEPSEASSEPPVVIRTATPEVYGCTKLYDNAFVILGTCEEGAIIYCTANGVTDFSASDHGYFSFRVKSTASSLQVKLWAEAEGKDKSEIYTYLARPKAVSSDQWDIIAGTNYQFHLDLTLPDFLHTNLYSQSKLENLIQRLRARQASYPDTEIIYLLVPSPATVYPETMPGEYKQKGNISRLDQVMGALAEAGIKYIDIKTLFAGHKNDEHKIYWKTDSHWTDYGAYLVYNELFSYISKKHPNAAPRAFDDFNWKTDYYVGGDVTYYLEYFRGLYSDNLLMKEYSALRVPKFSMPAQISAVNRYVSDKILTFDQSVMLNKIVLNTGRSALPSAIVMRDSYSTQIFDILAERFNITCYEPMWSFSINSGDVARYKPDYIIYIIVERNLDSVFN